MEKFKELSNVEIHETNGDFIPLEILGVTYTATKVAAAAGTFFLAGFAGGIAIGAAVD